MNITINNPDKQTIGTLNYMTHNGTMEWHFHTRTELLRVMWGCGVMLYRAILNAAIERIEKW